MQSLKCVLFVTILVPCLGLVACSGDDDDSPDMGTVPTDLGLPEDTGVVDMGPPDAGTDDMGTADTGVEDTGVEDTGVEDTGSTDTGAEDTGAVDVGAEDMGMVDLGAPDMGAGDAGPMPDAGTGPNTDMQIAAVRSQAVGGTNTTLGSPLPIQGAVVTYVLPAGVADSGFFVQSSQTGPAIFVNTGTVAAGVSVGDVVDLDVSEVNDNNDFLEVSDLSGLAVVGTGTGIAGLIQDVSTATDTVSDVRAYESERIRITGTLVSGSGFAGSGYLAYQMDTAGVMNDPDLRFRLPDGVNTALDPSEGCSLTASGAMWRFRSDAQPQVWELTDITDVSCPLAAAAASATSVVLDFGRNLDPTSVLASGSQFTVAGLTVSAAAVAGSQVTLTTSMQTSGTSYTVQVAGTVTDVAGSAIGAPNDTATFSGYTPPAAVVINEVYYDEPGGDGPGVFTELFGPAGTNLSGWTLVGINGSNGSDYVSVSLSGVIPSDGFYVVATSAATGDALANRDQVGDVDFQNGPDAVQLRDGAGAVIDALQYGSFTPVAGEGTPAPDVSSGESLTRDAAHTDTDDNATDFSVSSSPSPGS